MFKKILFFILANLFIFSFVFIGKDVVLQLWSDYTFSRVEKSIQKNYKERKADIEELIAYAESLSNEGTTQYMMGEKLSFAFSLYRSEFLYSSSSEKYEIKPASNVTKDKQEKLTNLLRRANCDAILIEEDGDVRVVYDGTLMLFHYEYLFLKQENSPVSEYYLQLDKGVYCGFYDANLFCGLWFFNK